VHLKLVNIVDVNSHDNLILLEIRNETNIRNNMFSKDIISINQHQKWVKDLSNSNYKKVFCTYANDAVIGALGYTLIGTNIDSCTWSFYISEKSRILGLAPYLEFSFLDYLFYKKNLTTIYADVLSSNQLILNLHKKFGFEIVTKQEFNVNNSNDFNKIRLAKQSWDENRNFLIRKFSSIFDRFELEIIEN
jgi:UDP-4-amino-4,6-dideoxy-N-acetyl-beta-L-altrosamine N-acetyltransferase